MAIWGIIKILGTLHMLIVIESTGIFMTTTKALLRLEAEVHMFWVMDTLAFI